MLDWKERAASACATASRWWKVIAPGGEATCCGKVTPEDVPRLVEEHLKQGKPVRELLIMGEGAETDDYSFLQGQHRILLKNCGHIDPEDIESYMAVGGYEGLKKALTSMTPEEVIEEIKRSGLRGRGGAGFPTHAKWSFTRQAPGKQKYIVCNADEGDPGAFMDRSILEGDPHSVLEGMLIAGYAIGANTGYIYIRAEYPGHPPPEGGYTAGPGARFSGRTHLGTDYSMQIIIGEGPAPLFAARRRPC